MNFEFLNIVSLKIPSIACLVCISSACVWESCLGWLVPNCRVELFLCTPSAPWTNAWKTVWFGADFKPVAAQRDVVSIWGLWWVRGPDAACTGVAEPREGRLLIRSRCHPCGFAMEVSATSSPWLSTWTPSGSGGPAGRQRWAAGGGNTNSHKSAYHNQVSNATASLRLQRDP